MSIVGHAVIAAAGVGSRLGHGIPKALIDVCGRLIIEYQLHLLRDVEDVRVVVGYHERAVIAAVRRVRADVIFVRNPAYRHTTTLQSLHLAARDLRGKSVLILDGDTVYGARSFATFLETCRERSSLVSIADEISEDPVYANTAEDADGITVTGFSRTVPSHYEWANLALVPADYLTNDETPVFERLSAFAPLPACRVERLEVDTEKDLAACRARLERDPGFAGDLP
ncbi:MULTISPECIES: NTP transferase domain-containing protein [Methylobacterium]|uniref:NTP transferase domain-containing protein n=1 Tax=Methylobacterium longum TaxID=767694 RepID=A0ABT8AY11_9HYPH|nr:MULTISPECIES: NTP transferase domain-containing protein [Methylobacterium]MCJ2097570.1 NTP transferase domain-containing protein [Methylobacterium sp. E-046]MDN3574847.1 NTP transferase domain-containing protein [Methylobacterium longum]GJE13887.1 2-C-methyl-D-erythritol 4-phosphate cytidylyltransferase [Methylobacterium longum]